MASASKTPNLNLPQWVETEKPQRTDFNAAFDAIDDAIADQEEGTWTPALSYQTPGTMSATYLNQYGYYVKNGSLITLYACLTVSTFTKGTASGLMTITGLPFTSSSDTFSHSSGSFATLYARTPTTAGRYPWAVIDPSSNAIALAYTTDNLAASSMDAEPDDYYFCTITYRT